MDKEDKGRANGPHDQPRTNIHESCEQVHSPIQHPPPKPFSDFSHISQRKVVAEYPAECLPEALRKACAEVSRFAKVPLIAPALTGLASIAIAIGKQAKVEERGGLTHFPSLFFIGIAGSGERKSDPFRLMQRPLLDWEVEQSAGYESRCNEIKAHNEVVRVRINKIKRRLGGKNEISDQEEVNLNSQLANEIRSHRTNPPKPRLVTSDATEEKLFQLMHDRGGAFAVMSGEGRPVIDHILGRYSSDGFTGDSIYLAGISGDKISRDRVGQGKTEERDIPAPCLNVCILVQPDKYQEVIKEKKLRESGAIARMFCCELPSKVGTRFEGKGEQGLNQGELQSYYQTAKRLIGLRGRDNGYHLARFSPDASELRREWSNAIERKLAEFGDFEDFRDIASKIVSTACKLALVIHIFEAPELLEKSESEISGDVFGRAQRLSEFHLNEAVRLLRGGSEKAQVEPSILFLRWLLAKGHTQFRVPDIINLVTRKMFPDGDRKTGILYSICNQLLKAGWLVHLDAKAARYDVHPQLEHYLQEFGCLTGNGDSNG